MRVVLKSIMLVAALGLFSDGSTTSLRQSLLLAQVEPKGAHYCLLHGNVTGDRKASESWGARLGLKLCKSSADNLTLLDVHGLEGLKKLAKQQFPTVKVLSEKQRNCLMDAKQNGHPAATRDLITCGNILAPPTGSSNDERRMATRGISVDSKTSEIVGNCKPNQPCRIFNLYGKSGILEKMFKKCGALKEFVATLAYKPTRETVNLTGPMQNSVTGLSDQCYARWASKDGIRGPLYGPIYWFNAIFIYLVKGVEGLGNMPGCKVGCANTCQNECAPYVDEIFARES